MYTQEKDEIKQYILGLQDALDDCLKWDAQNDDMLNEELGEIQNLINELMIKIKI